MTMRTIQFYGQGYGSTPCSITATLDGTQVFSGVISTIDGPDTAYDINDQVVLFTFDIDVTTEGPLPMSLVITGDDIYLGQVLANYCSLINPVFTAEQLASITDPATPTSTLVPIYEATANPPLSSEDIATLTAGQTPENWQAYYNVLVAHNITTIVSSGPTGYYPATGENQDARANVTCTGQSYLNPAPVGEYSGTWGWEVENYPNQSSTMTFNFNIAPGQLPPVMLA